MALLIIPRNVRVCWIPTIQKWARKSPVAAFRCLWYIQSTLISLKRCEKFISLCLLFLVSGLPSIKPSIWVMKFFNLKFLCIGHCFFFDNCPIDWQVIHSHFFKSLKNCFHRILVLTDSYGFPFPTSIARLESSFNVFFFFLQ